VSDILIVFTGILTRPLGFMPVSVQLFLSFAIGFFGLYIVGRALRWLWDVLPWL